VRPVGSSALRTRCELKNMNSFNFISRGIEAEIARQIAVYESGDEIQQETYDFDAASGTLTAHRSKEEAEDYRYFPEPDLVPYEPSPELVERLKAEIPESPGARLARLEPVLGYETALELVTSGRDALHSELVEAGVEAKAAANVLMNQLAAAGVDPGAVNAIELAELIEARLSIPRAAFDDAIAHAGDLGFHAETYLAEASISDTDELEPLIERILAANPGQVEQYRGGKEGLLGFFVGQVMKQTQGKANAKVVSELVRSKLNS
jgi:aspartyl-tRNA(Asn)/glutamyl-tRNA(Gln) amidotransferase subunit B